MNGQIIVQHTSFASWLEALPPANAWGADESPYLLCVIVGSTKDGMSQVLSLDVQGLAQNAFADTEIHTLTERRVLSAIDPDIKAKWNAMEDKAEKIIEYLSEIGYKVKRARYAIPIDIRPLSVMIEVPEGE